MQKNKKKLLFLVIIAVVVIIVLTTLFYNSYKIRKVALDNLLKASAGESILMAKETPTSTSYRPNQPPSLSLSIYPASRIVLGDSMTITASVSDPECQLMNVTIQSRNLRGTGTINCRGQLLLSGNSKFFGNDDIIVTVKDQSEKTTKEKRRIFIEKSGYGYGYGYPPVPPSSFSNPVVLPEVVPPGVPSPNLIR